MTKVPWIVKIGLKCDFKFRLPAHSGFNPSMLWSNIPFYFSSCNT